MSNIIDIFVDKQAQKELDKSIESLKKINEEIAKINRQALNINASTGPSNPSDLANLIRQNEELSRRYRELEERLRLLNVQRQTASQRTSEEIVNQRQLAQNADRQTRATSALVGAYQNLNAQHQIASRRLQDLVATGRRASQTQSQYNRELRQARSEFQALDTRIQMADRAVGRFNRNVGNYRQALGGFRDLLGAFGLAGGIALFSGLVKSIYDTTKELQSLDNALKQVSGTSEQMAKNQAFLRDISESFGLEINALTKQFTQFYVSAKDKLSGTEIENIFRSISKAGATMGLSVESQERAFLAINQMMSKGVVSAEELRGQLGEALPGAFGIMAKAVGVTEKELGKLMKDGKLMADEVLPKFAKALESTYGIEVIERVETLTASQNRLSNSWTDFVRSINESETGGISQFFQFISDGLNGIIKLLIRANTSFEELYKKASDEGKAQGEKAGKSFFDSQIKSAGKKLTVAERVTITKRVEEIKKTMTAGFNDPKLENELKGLIKRLQPSEKYKAKALFELAPEEIKKAQKEIDLLNKKIEESYEKESSFMKRTFAPNTSIYKKRDLEDKLKEANFDLAYWQQVQEEAKNFGKEIEKVNKIEKDGDKVKKTKIKIQKEKIDLNFREIESEYNLKKSILERQKIERQDRASDENLSFEQRLIARKEFSEKSIEILNLEIEKEKAILLFKQAEDFNKNNLALKNKEISQKQHLQNVSDINKRYNNEVATVDMEYSLKWNDLLNSDADYYQKIQEEKLKFTQDTAELITNSEKEKFKEISDNEENTLLVRNLAHAKFLEISKQQLQSEKILAMARAKTPEELTYIIQKYEDLSKELNKIDSPYDKARESFEKYLESISSGEFEKALDKIGVGSLKMFIDFDKKGQNSFSKLFEVAETTGEKIALGFQAIGDVFQETMSLISSSSQARFNSEYQRLEKEKDIRLMFAGDSASAREEIERQSEEKRKEIAKRESETQKRLAVFNIAINTAQAVVASFAKTGFTPLGIASAGAMAILGAAQIAMVQSQQIPEFWMGTDNAPEGLALTQERGPEIITDKKGKIKTLGNNKGAQLTYLESGDKVYKSHQDYINKVLVNTGIAPIQENNSLTNVEFKNGISKLAKSMQVQPNSTQVYLNNKRIDTDYFKGKNY